MIGYITLGANDLDRAMAFYDTVLAPLGAKQLMPTPRGVLYGVDRPAFEITTPFDGRPATPGNGTMIALVAPNQGVIEDVHARALALGGVCEGKPGDRGEGFYGAYFRDLDGNKICVFRMDG